MQAAIPYFSGTRGKSVPSSPSYIFYFFLLATSHIRMLGRSAISLFLHSLLQTDLQKGKQGIDMVERRMLLMLNKHLWNPLPDRWEDSRVLQAMLKDLKLLFVKKTNDDLCELWNVLRSALKWLKLKLWIFPL
jgi:hypothetical protein